MPFVPDGAYDFDEHGNAFELGLLEFLKEAKLSRESLLELQKLTKTAQAEGIPREGFAAAANEIAPDLGTRLNTFLGNNQYSMTFLQTLMAILATLIAGYALFKPDSPPQTVVNNYNYYSSGESPKTEQAYKPRPGKLGSNVTLPKKPRKKRGKRT